jgi:hypothetical protein
VTRSLGELPPQLLASLYARLFRNKATFSQFGVAANRIAMREGILRSRAEFRPALLGVAWGWLEESLRVACRMHVGGLRDAGR